MYIKPALVVKEDDVLAITCEMGYGEAIKDYGSIANLFWGYDFVNDCYKELFFNDDALNNAIEDTIISLDIIEFDEEVHKNCLAKEFIIKALRKYCEEHNILAESILVDLSW